MQKVPFILFLFNKTFTPSIDVNNHEFQGESRLTAKFATQTCTQN